MDELSIAVAMNQIILPDFKPRRSHNDTKYRREALLRYGGTGKPTPGSRISEKDIDDDLKLCLNVTRI